MGYCRFHMNCKSKYMLKNPGLMSGTYAEGNIHSRLRTRIPGIEFTFLKLAFHAAFGFAICSPKSVALSFHAFVSPKGERGFFVSFLADAAETNEQPPNLTYPPEIGWHMEGQCSIDGS